MNYRHAFHAGNFADCFKHALLLALLRALARKPAPFGVLDTHAGTGFYDLNADEARRTGEAEGGILRLQHAAEPALQDYLQTIAALGLYPGSPALIRSALRAEDRLTCCELHPEDAALLRRRFRRDAQVSVHERDGYAALTALLPPAQRRGLVLIDPPFEVTDEFARLAAGIAAGKARFPAGIFAAWYPIKHRAPVREFHFALRDAGLKDVIAAEFLLREPLDPTRLNGCGLLVVNPPWQFEAEAMAVMTALLRHLGGGEPGEGAVIHRIADE